MATLTIPNVRVSSDIRLKVTLTDNGVSVDWSSINDISAIVYFRNQRMFGARAVIEEIDGTDLILYYSADRPQFLGIADIVINCEYQGFEKTFDKPAVNFVDTTQAASGTISVTDDTIAVDIAVEEVDTSILDNAIYAAIHAAERAEDAASAAERMVDLHTGPQGNTGASLDYPYELVNNVTTDDATKGLSAAQGVVLQGEIDQLGQEVHTLSGKYYGLFTSSAILPSEITQPGYAFVGSSTPFAIWNFDGSAWTDTGATVDAIHGEDGVGFASVASQQDGTIVITLTNGDTVTIDLNHDHPAYPKYELMEDEAEYQAIATKESDKLYLIPETSA